MMIRAEGSLSVGALEVDLDSYHARYDGRALDLSRSELELLALLVANRRRVMSRVELSETLGLARGRSVDVLLTKLRKAIGHDFVRNVRSRGWILASERPGD